MSCGVDDFVLHVNDVSPATRNLEHRPATRVDRWMDRSLSSRSREPAFGFDFGAAAGSAPPFRALSAVPTARRESAINSLRHFPATLPQPLGRVAGKWLFL